MYKRQVIDGIYTTMVDNDDITDGDRAYSRRLFTDDSSSTYTSYSATYNRQTDTFTVTLGSYDPVGC